MKTRLLIAFFIILYTQANAQVPVADFTANRTSGCSPLTVTFQDISTNDPKYWNWDFGNSELSTQKNPTITFRQPGVYSVTLVVRNGDGTNGITKTAFITVYPSPVASFTPSTTSACVPSEIHFTDRSTSSEGTITNWLWNFGDGETSTEQNPSHIYTTPGFYTVSLRVTSSTGCEAASTRVRLIRIVSGVEANFTATTPETCNPPYVVNFLNQSSGPGELTHRWQLGAPGNSTETSPVAIYNQDENFNVTLITSSEFGCSDTITKPVSLQGISTNFTGEDSLCIGTPATYTNQSGETALSSRWLLNDVQIATGNSIVRQFNTPGEYQLKLINQYANCTDSVTRTIRVMDQPSINFTNTDAENCSAPFQVDFTDNTANAREWRWSFGDGQFSTEQNPSHTYNQLGSYHVSLIVRDAFGCVDTLTVNNRVRIVKPVIRVSNNNVGGCAPFTYRPSVTTTTTAPITSWQWDFGNGQVFNTMSPTATYTNPGTYDVSVTITTADGCTETLLLRNNVRVGTPVTPDFTADITDLCSGSEVQFTDLTTGANQWLWDFGDGDTSTERNPVHIYTSNGEFTVSLTAYNNGCPTTVTKTQFVTVRPPVAEFNFTSDCSNFTEVQFTNSSVTDPAFGPISYLWNFGDGNTSTDEHPINQYSGPGIYNVSLEVANGACTSMITRPLPLEIPSAQFTINNNTLCRNENIILTSTETNTSLIATYQWRIGASPLFTDGRTTTQRRSNRGSYDVELILTDTNGCVYSHVEPDFFTIVGPTSSFSIPDAEVCLGSPVSFNDLSTSNQAITRWTFDYGDGNRQDFTQPGNFNHSYSDSGTYTVRLTVEDLSGCTNTSTRTNGVFVSNPIARIDFDSVLHCQGMPLEFSADSSSGRNLSFEWEFGDGSSGTGIRPVHTYTGDDADYNIFLKVTDDVGCSDSILVQNLVSVKSPKPAFTASDTLTICPPLEVHFTNASSDYQTLYWNFNDGTDSSIVENPRHFFNDYQTFEVKLYTVGFGGCLDSAVQNIHLINPNVTRVNYSPLSNCNELDVNFELFPPNDLRFIFNFGDGTRDSSQNRFLQHYYGSPANYNPSILLMDKVGCQANLSAGPPIRVIGAQPLFGVDNTQFCDSGTVFFTNYTLGNDPVVDWRWDMGDNTIINNGDHQQHRFTSPGEYITTLSVVTASGCSNQIADTIMVYSTPHTNILSADTICIQDMALFSAMLLNPDTATINYRWALGNGESSTLREPNTVYNTTGDFAVSLQTSNAFGCQSVSNKTVHVVPLPTVTPVEHPVIFAGESVNLQMNYTGPIVNYNWVPATNLSCNECPDPVATPRRTTTYNIEIIDSRGCKNSSEVTVTVVCGNNNLFIPNTFSPNGDGRNDSFYPLGTGLERIQSLRIFNRWGEKVFEKTNFSANSPAEGWNGMVKGKPASPDVYIYTIEVICENGEVFPYTGNVMLIR